MNRKALIIANPGEPGPDNCKGVLKDVDRYRAFLQSPNGGLWREDEIKTLQQPSATTTDAEVRSLANADYSLTVFCGHGFYSAASHSTIVQLSASVDLDSNELRRGAAKHSLIIDSCRVVERPAALLMEDAIAKRAKQESIIHPGNCRRYFDEKITNCPQGLVVLFACSVGQTAGDSEADGGWYSYSLVSTAEVWSRQTYVNTEREYRSLSLVEAHDGAIPRVSTLSAGRQTPTIEKPRSGPYFPFCIIA